MLILPGTRNDTRRHSNSPRHLAPRQELDTISGENTMNNLHTPESWNKAREIASIAQLTPNAFSTCVRYIAKDVVENKTTLSKVTHYCLRTAVRSASARTALYYAALTFKPDQLDPKKEFSADYLSTIFSPHDLAHLIALYFIFRRVKRGCGEQGLGALQDLIFKYGEIGGLVGAAIPNIGIGTGIIVGTMRFLGQAMFIGIDPQGSEKYQKFLQKENRLFDLAGEIAIWGCSHLQVAAMMMQLIGLGIDAANSFVEAFTPSIKGEDELPTEVFRRKITWTWIEAFVNTGLPPDIAHRGEYYPRAQDLEKATHKIKSLLERGSEYRWMIRGKEDASKEATPGLFVTSEAKSGQFRVEDSVVDEIEQLSDEELKVEEE